jgi:hypothetical protein
VTVSMRLKSPRQPDRPLWPFPDVPVPWPCGTRLGRRGIVSRSGRVLKTGTALPSQTCELATGTAKGNWPLAGSERPNPFFVKDVECRQAKVEDFLFMEDDFAALSCVARHRIERWRRVCQGCSARQRQRQSRRPQNRNGFSATRSLGSLLSARHCRTLPGYPRFGIELSSTALVPIFLGQPACASE